MLSVEVDRNSVHAGDDIKSHRLSLTVNENTNLRSLIDEVLSHFRLPSISNGEATWIVSIDADPKLYICVIAQQWEVPKMFTNESKTVKSIFTMQPVKIYFTYLGQVDPNKVFHAIENNEELPWYGA